MTGTERPTKSSGYVLLEVLVAFLIAAVALYAVAGLLTTSLKGQGSLESRLAANQLARSLMAGIGTIFPIANGRSEFNDGAGSSWQITMTPIEEVEEADFLLFRIDIDVERDDGGSASLTGFRIGEVEER